MDTDKKDVLTFYEIMLIKKVLEYNLSKHGAFEDDFSIIIKKLDTVLGGE